jgi:hypothetical protein
MVEYESLIQGLKKAIDLKVKCLKVFGDSEIIVRQVKNSIHCLSPHIKGYQQEVWKLINYFDAFNITSIPHSQNVVLEVFVCYIDVWFLTYGIRAQGLGVSLLHLRHRGIFAITFFLQRFRRNGLKGF